MAESEIRILLVEDDRDDYVLTQGLLDKCSDSQYELLWEATYGAGLEALRSNRIDVCLIDYKIGGRTGLEFIAEASHDRSAVPMILLTGARDRSIDIAATRVGAADFLEKASLTPELLERSLRYAMRHAEDLVALEQARASLAEANDQLETKVQQRTKELLEANEALRFEITERKRAEQLLRHSGLHDPLTELPNRELFVDRVNQSVGRTTRSSDKTFAIMVVNLDRFRVVNDGLGHRAGNEVLSLISCRLQDAVRPGDTVARLGGDEFGVLIEDIAAAESARQCAQRLQKLLEQPILIDAQRVYAMFSAGIAVSTLGYCSAESMLQDARTAMANAKRRGKGRIEVFDISMRSNTAGLLELESDLRRATAQGDEFELHYQPVMDLRQGRVAGFEALLRWRHPERGLLGPGEFLQIAEESRLIVPIGRWVLKEAVRQLRSWQKRSPANDALFMSVNVSRYQLDDDDLIEDVRSTLEETGVKPGDLKLEITESVLMIDPDKTTAVMERLNEIGVCLSIDDFGTGYSNLSYLRQFPFQVLKIDRSFVRAMALDEEDFRVVQAINTLAVVLGMEVVAEGAETAQEVECLRSLDCQFVQGYYFSPPLAPDKVAKMLDDSRDRGSPTLFLDNSLARAG